MTFQMILILIVLTVTIFLFITKFLRIDIVAILVMVSLPWLGLVTPAEAFSGFASNAVIIIIAVMIIGYGMDRSGALNRLIEPIMTYAGQNEKLIVVLISAAAGLVSAFMPNVGATALFLPAILRIARSTGMHASRILMPAGFAAIMGGNLTMVGSSPLLILNDLLKHTGKEAFSLFSVMPAGLILLTVSILYFLLFDRYILPAVKDKKKAPAGFQQRLIETWRLPTTIYQCVIPPNSKLAGKTRTEVKMRTNYRLNLLAIAEGNDLLYAPWRYTTFNAGQSLAILGDKNDFEKFISDFKLIKKYKKSVFKKLTDTIHAGFAELIIPVKSPLAGKSLQDIAIRKAYGVEPIMLLNGEHEERVAFSDQVLQPGSTIIIHGLWERIKSMADNINFVLVTPVESTGSAGDSKPVAATLCLAATIVLTLSGFPISLSFLTGAIAMILSGIVPIDEAYRAIDWKTVFLLAGLIPLGIAMNKTGTAEYIASQMIFVLKEFHPVIILFAVGTLSTLLSLFMSNITTTVLLVPLVMIMGTYTAINPRGLALLVALCASNGFILPVHQVNALIMSPGRYENKDFIKAGSLLSIIYITISVFFIYILFT